MGDLIHAGRRTPLAAGRTLFDSTDELDGIVPDTCRRTGRCRECVVEVRAGGEALGPTTAAEAYLRPPFRLACQATIEDAAADVEVAVVRRQLQIVSTAGGDPAIERPFDLDPPVARDDDGAARRDGRRLEVPDGPLLGLAIDLGTTTIALALLDIETGAVRHRAALENPQRFAGSDVIARIEYARADADGELRRCVRRAIDHELSCAYAALGIDRRSVVEVVVVGNPTMRDLFLGLDVAGLGTRPFRSVAETALRAGLRRSTVVLRRAHETGLLVHPEARVVGGPLVGSHVGADIAADVLAVDMAGGPAVSILIDIGTNSEIVARARDRWLAASSPAGPAFEGGGIGGGMPAVDGAIQAVRSSDSGFDVTVIGGGEPEGICGSGLIDLMAELLRSGRLRRDGSFADGSRGLDVVPGRVHLARRDVALLAQAKAANSSGQEILLERLGVRADDVERIWLAGGFASYVDLERAIDIGLLPPVPLERIAKVGNASLAGASRLLVSRRVRAGLERIVAGIEHVELELDPSFMDRFIDGCRWEPRPPGRSP
jgi:uncharacterized 2Fe-2S/4Fe-4S cluster protein (DUF4445 family)